MADPIPITPETCRKFLGYEAASGKLYWLVRAPSDFLNARRPDAYAKTWNTRYAGKEAFTAINSRRGYRFGTINDRPITAHRVIWAIAFGEWPNHIDHINGDRLDNRLENLRSVTNQENCRNRALAPPASGSVGVRWLPRHKKWQARIGNEFVGNFTAKADAIKARNEAERAEGYHPNHGRAPAS